MTIIMAFARWRTITCCYLSHFEGTEGKREGRAGHWSKLRRAPPLAGPMAAPRELPPQHKSRQGYENCSHIKRCPLVVACAHDKSSRRPVGERLRCESPSSSSIKYGPAHRPSSLTKTLPAASGTNKPKFWLIITPRTLPILRPLRSATSETSNCNLWSFGSRAESPSLTVDD